MADTEVLLKYFPILSTLFILLATQADIAQDPPCPQPTSGETELMKAVRCGLSGPISRLLQNDRLTDPNQRDGQGQTALILAVRCRWTGLLSDVLHANRLDPNLRDNDGLTALMWAVRQGDTGLISILLHDNRIDLKVRDNKGLTAEMWAEETKKYYLKKILHAEQERRENGDGVPTFELYHMDLHGE